MRGGVLLAEDSPANILTKFRATSLEDAFLLMCIKQGSDEAATVKTNSIENGTAFNDVIVTNANHINHNNNGKIAINGGNHYHNNHLYHNNVVNDPKKTVAQIGSENGKHVYTDSEYNDNNNEKRRSSVMEKIKFTSRTRMKALLAKNVIQMIRQPA